MTELDRRAFLATAGAAAATAARGLLPAALHAESAHDPHGDLALAMVAQSLRDEHDYDARVEGALPADLVGTLFRNGPGLFERDGVRKRSILDGDGMIQAFDFRGGRVRYRNRFVRTRKFLAEEAAGHYLYPTWTTRAPGWWRNLPAIPTESQAGVVPVVKHGQLLAIDEVGEPWALDPRTLDTTGEYTLGVEGSGVAWKAHTKTDAETGQWVAVGMGTDGAYHIAVRDGGGRLIATRRVDAGDRTYIHDYFATPNHVVLNIHPAVFGPKGLLLMTGFASVMEALSWAPERGSQVIVVDLREESPPLILEAPAAWMWHAVNAWERDGEIVADFIGYEEPDHFLGDDAALTMIMEGRLGVAEAEGTLRRYVIDTRARRLRSEVIDDGNQEYPAIAAREAGHRHSAVWACTDTSGIFHDGLVRIDTETGARDAYVFGPGHVVGEPVLVSGADGAPAWLLSLVFRASTRTSHLAVLRADALADGPVARVELEHHTPYSFHGTWWDSTG